MRDAIRGWLAAVCLALIAVTAAACTTMPLQHTETSCINPGQVVTVRITTTPGAALTWKVQDDFGGEIAPAIAATTADGSGHATATWSSQTTLQTTTVHILVTARTKDMKASRDIHVIVGGQGRSC